jgi:hypothetical protein
MFINEWNGRAIIKKLIQEIPFECPSSGVNFSVTTSKFKIVQNTVKIFHVKPLHL